MEIVRQSPKSSHFGIEQIADGVYAAIHQDGGAAIGNAGIIDLGDRLLAYDSMFTPQAAEDLRKAAETLAGRPVDLVINSHYHNDHIWGNQVFGPDTDIVATVKTRELILATRGHDDFDTFMANAEANLQSTRTQFQRASDAARRRQLRFWLDYHQSLVRAKPVLQVRPPNMTFEGRMTLHGSERSAELIAFENGHSSSDTVLFLPEGRIAFMSDLLFIDCHPYIGAGDPHNLSRILVQVGNLDPRLVVPGHGQVGNLDPRLVVPGHGQVGTADSLVQMRHYLSTLDSLARRMVDDGEPEAAIDHVPVPEPWDDWPLVAFFPLNLRVLYQIWTEKPAEGAA